MKQLLLFPLLFLIGLGGTPDAMQTEASDISHFRTMLESRNIVYLVSPDADVDNLVSEPSLRAMVNAIPVHSEAELHTYELLLRPDAILLHESALDFVDTTWLQEQYQAGIVIVAFDMAPQTFAELLDIHLTMPH